MATSTLDQWAAWLFHRRHGNDAPELERTLARLATVRDRVLANGLISAGDTLLDVGTGDGLIAFGALQHVGDKGHVIFSDVSQDLLDHDQIFADKLGVLDRCQFVRAPADDLAAIADATVDIVTTRSVIAYVKNKRQAFAEFARVLRQGGRISLYEPINRLINPEPPHHFAGYNITPIEDIAMRVSAVYEQRQPLEDDPMFDFDEHDLLAFAESAGFSEVHLELHIDVRPHAPQRWEIFSTTAINPLVPTIEEAMGEVLAPGEREQFTAYLRPLVEEGKGTFRIAVAYLWGTKH